MLIFTLFCLLVVAYSFRDFKRAFVFYSAFKMFALGAMCLKYTPPALSMETFLNFYFVLLFLNKGYLDKYKLFYNVFPLRKFFNVQLVSIAASALVTMVPFFSFITGLIMALVEDFAYPLLFYILLRKDKNIVPMFIKYSMALFFFASIIGFYEYATRRDVFAELLYANVPEELLIGKFFHGGERLGMIRMNSIFASPNNWIYGAFLSVLVYSYNTYSSQKIRFSLAFTFLSIVTILLANSRTVLISSIIIVAPLFFRISKSSKFFLVAVAFSFLVLPYFERYSANITSVIDSSRNTAIEGSSVEMREEQLMASWMLFERSPIVGNGYQSIKYFLSAEGGSWGGQLRGTESIWFKLLIERGLLGIFAYLYMFYLMNIKFRVLRNSILLFYLGGYLLANTMSSLPGFNMSFLYISMIMLHHIINMKLYAYRNNNITSSDELWISSTSVCSPDISFKRLRRNSRNS